MRIVMGVRLLLPVFLLAIAGSLHGQERAPVVTRPLLVVAVVNNSTYVADSDVTLWAAAITQQLHNHLAPIWKVDADVIFSQTPPAGAWVCTLVDGGTYATGNPLGIHTVTADGTPACTVYAGMVVQNQLGPVSKPLSHEIMEMLVDPYLSSMTLAQGNDSNSATVYLREICDPVWAYGYLIDGVTVSDFSYPAFWLGGFPPPGSQLDYMGIATVTLTPTASSYMMVRYISTFGGINSLVSWTYIWGSYCAFGPC
jgi:hypothetical protein